MDKTILNLMLSNLEGSSQESTSENDSISDGFEFMKNECKENCYQKFKPILQQAAQTIKLKDRQIDNLINLALRTCPDLKTSFDIKLNGAGKEKNTLDIVQNYENQLKDENVPLDESNEKVNNLEVQKQLTENQLEEMREKINEQDVLIKYYQTKVKKLEGDIKTMSKNVENRVENYPNKLVFRTNFNTPVLCTIENNVAGPGWIVVQQLEMCEGTLKEVILLDSKFVYNLIKNQRYELYIHVVNEDKSSSYARYHYFTINPNQLNSIEKLHDLETSMEISGCFDGVIYKDLYTFFGHKPIKYQLMIRPQLNVFLQNVIDNKKFSNLEITI